MRNLEVHRLIKSYRAFIANRSDYRIGVIGQPDAGKSSLINAVVKLGDAYTAVHSDATLELKEYLFEDYGMLTDFPGVGTEEISVSQYKKLIMKSGIKQFIYVFSSKIKSSDIEIIKFLNKHKKRVIFVYNKTDALVDVKNKDDVEVLKRDKNLELKMILKNEQKDVEYIFVSTLTKIGIKELKANIQALFNAQKQDYKEKYNDAKMVESFLNYKTNTLIPKLFTPTFKKIIMRKNYLSIERTVLFHFRIEEDDIINQKRPWPSMQTYIELFEEENHVKANRLRDVKDIVILFRTAFKVKSINPIAVAFSSLIEVGIHNAFPIFQAITSYISEIKDIARTILLESREK